MHGRAQKRKQAFHEPPPHPFPLPLRGGEGGRRSGEGRFMVPMHAEKRKGALHEPPPHPVPLPIRWGEGGRRPGEGRFMVPMHAEKRKGAFHEPSPRSGVSAERRWLVVAPNCGALPRRRYARVHRPNAPPE